MPPVLLLLGLDLRTPGNSPQRRSSSNYTSREIPGMVATEARHNITTSKDGSHPYSQHDFPYIRG